MPALPPYIPRQNAKEIAWMQNFAALITANPALYGLASGDATAINAVVNPLVAQFAVINSKSTKTAAAVSDFNTLNIQALQTVRPYAQQISLNAGVTSANKIALGVNPRTSTPSPITPPATNPVLTVQALAPGVAYLRYRDSAASPSVKSKPYGVTSVTIVGIAATIAAPPSTPPSQWPTIISATKSPINLPTTAFAAGSQLYVAGQYLLRNGKVSAWSPVINFTVPQIA